MVRYGDNEKDELQLRVRLLRSAYARVPDEAIASLERVIDSENERTGHLFVLSEIETCWDGRMAEAMLRKANDANLKPEVLVGLVSTLASHEVPRWKELPESLIQESSLENANSRERMRAATAALLLNAPDAGWPRVRPIFVKHPDFGRQVIESLSYGRPGGMNFANGLTEQQMGELYIWMVGYYPIEQRRRMSGAMSSVDTAIMFRDSLLRATEEEGDFCCVRCN